MYYLGVDGGNTKTDFALMHADGTLVDWIRVGTCSHEALSGGYTAAADALAHWLNPLRACNGIRAEQIEDAVLGLAGAATDAPRCRCAESWSSTILSYPSRRQAHRVAESVPSTAQVRWWEG